MSWQINLNKNKRQRQKSCKAYAFKSQRKEKCSMLNIQCSIFKCKKEVYSLENGISSIEY